MPALEQPGGAQMSSSSPEFVAVVLATTTGARLFPLTSNQTPKHLLPVGGIPLLLRLLNTIESSGFETCVVAVAKEDTVTVPLLKQNMMEQVSSHPHVMLQSKKKKKKCLQITVVPVSDDCAGSAEALRQLDDVIPPASNVVVLPGDLVVLEPTVLTKLADAHRQGNLSSSSTLHSACTILLSDVGEQDEHGAPLKESSKQKKGGLAREEEDIEYIGLSFPATNKSGASSPRVVWKQSKIEVEQDDDYVGKEPQLTLPKPRLHSGGITRVRTDWSDLHVYAISPWIRRLLSTRAHTISLQGDVLPLLVSRQFRGVVATFGNEAMKAHKDAVDEVISQPPFGTHNASSENGTSSPEQEEMTGSGHNTVSSNTKTFNRIHEYAVSAHVLQPRNSDSDHKVVALRASSIPAYLYSCRELVNRAVVSSDATPPNPCLSLPEGSTVNAKFHSVLLKDATTGDKVQCKSSTVGRRSKLGSKCKVNNVVIMDGVTVGDNCVLQNSILGAGCTIGANCSLNDCQVGPGRDVPSGTKEKGESFFEETATEN